MEFRNLTPFPALAFDSIDQRDILFHTLVMRLTYELQSDGTLSLAEDQAPLVMADQYYGELNQSSVKQESDLAPYKPHTDVILIAHAHAPSRTPSPRFMVGLKITGKPMPKAMSPERMVQAVEILDKQLIVCGPREWRRNSGLRRAAVLFLKAQWQLNAPTPISELPLRYEYAYGGENKILANDKAAPRVKRENRLPPSSNSDAASSGAVAHTVWRLNPVGRGFAEPWYAAAKKLELVPAPQIVAPGEPLTTFGKAITPCGFGVITRAWTPRLELAGTYDERWLQQRHPYLPFDFNFAYWNSAPPDQQIVPHLDGNETIILTNLVPPATYGSVRAADGNYRQTLTLPGHLPFVLVRFEEGEIGELAAKLDTLIIDLAPDPAQPDKKPTVTCAWRATVGAEPAVRVLEARMLALSEIMPDASHIN